jgi:hypothetical protein
VHLHRAVGDVERMGDLLVLIALNEARQDLHLAARQTIEMVRLAAARRRVPIGEQMGEIGGEDLLARRNPSRKSRLESINTIESLAMGNPSSNG